MAALRRAKKIGKTNPARTPIVTPESHSDREFADLLTRAEALLTGAWEGEVTLGEVERLSEPRGRNLVLRCAVNRAPEGSPSSVLLKRARPFKYDPDDPRSRPAVGLFRDWAGLQFLSTLNDEQLACARFYGGDREAGFFLMEDLRNTVDLDHLLTRSSTDEALHGLRLLAATLGRMHALSIGRADEYQQIRNALGPGDSAHRQRLAKHVRDYLPCLTERCERLQVPLGPGYEDDFETIAEAMAEPGEFLAYTHCDACPDNCRIAEDRLCLIDFEFANYRHALLDGVYGWIRFPTCWCARDLPESAVEAMETEYRRELAKGCPAAADDTRYFRAVAEACGYWLLENMTQLFDRSLQYEMPKGTSTNRQRILMRMAAFCQVAERSGHLEGLRQTIAGLLELLRELWRDDMPLFDAFGQPLPVTMDEVGEMAAAVRAGDPSRAGELLAQNPGLANTKAPDPDQTPMLYLAMDTQNEELVKLLLDHGADWRITTRSGWTILSRAVSHGTPEIVDLLIAQGAQLNRRDTWGLLPIYGVLASANPRMLQHVLDCGARPDLKMAIDLKQPELARRLLEANPLRARFRYGTGLTLLHDSARVGDTRLEAMKMLLEYGAPVNAKTSWGATPLHLAAFFGNLGTVEFLLANGADPEMRDKRSLRPYRLAKARGHARCADLLALDRDRQAEAEAEAGAGAAAGPARWQEGIDEVYSSFGGNGDREPHPLDDFAATQLLTFFHPGGGADVAGPGDEPGGVAVTEGGGVPAANVMFWLGKEGHSLVTKLNGDPESTLLGDWLAEHFENLFGALEGHTNEQVWKFFQERCDEKSAAVARGDDASIKLEVEALALGLALYVTNASLVARDRAGEGSPERIAEVEAHGFVVDRDGGGLAEEPFDVSAYGDPEDLDDVFSGTPQDGEGPVMMIWTILKAIDANTSEITSLAFDDDNDGDVLSDDIELSMRRIADRVLTDINCGRTQ